MSYLEYFLYLRAIVVWHKRKLPSVRLSNSKSHSPFSKDERIVPRPFTDPVDLFDSPYRCQFNHPSSRGDNTIALLVVSGDEYYNS